MMSARGTLETLEAMLADAKVEAESRRVTVEMRCEDAVTARKISEERIGLYNIAVGLARISLERVAALEDAIAALRDCL